MVNNEKIEEIVNSKTNNYGKAIYFLGTSIFGATNEPVLIKDLAHLYSIFGTKGTLIENYKELEKVLEDVNVYCCKLSGSHSIAGIKVNLFGGGIIENGIIFKSQYSNEIYNKIRIDIGKESIKFKIPTELGEDFIEYKFSDNPTVDKLIEAINKDTINGKNHIYAISNLSVNAECNGAFDTVNPSSLFFFGGNSGLNESKNSYYQYLKKTLEVLEGRIIDVIVPLELYIDDIDSVDAIYGESTYNEGSYASTRDKLNSCKEQLSFYDLLLQFSILQLQSGILTLGVIGYNPTSSFNTSSETDYVDTVLINYSLENKFRKETEDYRHLVSIVAGDLFSTITNKNISSAPYYGVIIAKSYLNVNITNVALDKNIFLYNEFSRSDLDKLTSNGIVTFRHSPIKNRVVVNAAVTSTHKYSEYFFLVNVRMLQVASSCIYDIFDLLIGEDINKILYRDMLLSILNKALINLGQLGYISKHGVTLERVGTHELEVILKLQTVYMTETITLKSVIREGDISEY